MTDTPLDLTQPVQTKRGDAVEIYDTNIAGGYSVVGVFIDSAGRRHIGRWTTNGNSYLDGTPNPFDLVNVPQSVYVNVYPTGSGRAYPTREEADLAAHIAARIAVLRITGNKVEVCDD